MWNLCQALYALRKSTADVWNNNEL